MTLLVPLEICSHYLEQQLANDEHFSKLVCFFINRLVSKALKQLKSLPMLVSSKHILKYLEYMSNSTKSFNYDQIVYEFYFNGHDIFNSDG